MHARIVGIGVLVLGVSVVVAAGQGQVAPVDLATAPPRITAAVARGNTAIQEMQSTLVTRLTAELARGGPAAAVAVCRDEALKLTADVAAKQGIAIGRTSHRLRNPANAPRPWAAAAVAAHAGRKAADVQPLVFDLGDRVGVLRPIGTMEFCLGCHGPRESVQATIGEVLKTSYPADQATGFSLGDLRGWAWAEVPAK